MFISGIVEITAFVKKLDSIRQCKKSVRKSNWNINLILFLCRESNTRPFSELRRADPDVDRDVYSFAFYHPAEFGLRTAQLVMQPQQRSLGRTRMVILNKAIYDAPVDKSGLVVSFQEEPAFVPEYPWPYLKDARK